MEPPLGKRIKEPPSRGGARQQVVDAQVRRPRLSASRDLDGRDPTPGGNVQHPLEGQPIQ